METPATNTQVASDDYKELLDAFSIDINITDLYYLIGKPVKEQGWILHISCSPDQFKELCNKILPIIVTSTRPFKITRSKQQHYLLNNGTYGYYKIGKIITVYLEEDAEDLLLVKALNAATKSFSGPTVLTDVRVGDILYIRYGSYSNTPTINEQGERLRYIVNAEGESIPDLYSSPATLPNWIENPFTELYTSDSEINSNLRIHRKYYPIKRLKSDVKGDVIKCAYFNKNWVPSFCIIKQGRMGMHVDLSDRDMQDILLWQYHAADKIQNHLPTPKVFDKFIAFNTQCIVLDFINGPDLLETAQSILINRTWFNLKATEQSYILELLSQIAHHLMTLHNLEFIHRDITGVNFLVSKKKVTFIDLELMYSKKEHFPNPPFGKGTPGFMSPNQEAIGKPQYKDDIYAYGALLLQIMNGYMHPSGLVEKNVNNLHQKLLYILGDTKIVEIILDCLKIDPSQRPEPIQLHEILTAYKNENRLTAKAARPNTDQIQEVIQHGINSICSNIMCADGLWYSYIGEISDIEINPLGDKNIYWDLHRGISGALYTLFKLKAFSFDIQMANQNIQYGWNFVKGHCYTGTLTKGGLHFGASGAGLFLFHAINDGVIKKSDEFVQAIKYCLTLPNSNLDIISGLAGDGLAILSCAELLGVELSDHLKLIVDQLIDQQLKDGSWETEPNKKVNGFGYGMAGIVYFLLEYGERLAYRPATDSAQRCLKYLIKNSRKTGSTIEWPSSNKKKTKGVLWCRGSEGIALTFFKAFEYLKNPDYLKIAESALRSYPKQFLFENLSQCHGVAGLGEIYLEALRVSKNQEWQERADWIAGLLCALKFQPASNMAYWLVEGAHFPTAGLMTGNSGILHFLLHYLHADKIFYPLLPKPIELRNN